MDRLNGGVAERDAAYRRLLHSQLDLDFGILTAVAVGVFALTGLLPVLGAGSGVALFAGATVAGLWGGAAARTLRRRRCRKHDLDLLVAARDPRVVAPLLEELHFYRSRYEGADAEALIRMLPTVRAEDPLFRYRWYQDALHNALRESGDPQMLVALLEAIGRVGDGRGIGYVRMLAENEGHFVRDERVARAALAVLPSLRTRFARTEPEPPRETMLRPAVSPADDPDHLLRNVRPGSDDDRLVRPMGDAEAEPP